MLEELFSERESPIEDGRAVNPPRIWEVIARRHKWAEGGQKFITYSVSNGFAMVFYIFLQAVYWYALYVIQSKYQLPIRLVAVISAPAILSATYIVLSRLWFTLRGR